MPALRLLRRRKTARETATKKPFFSLFSCLSSAAFKDNDAETTTSNTEKGNQSTIDNTVGEKSESPEIGKLAFEQSPPLSLDSAVSNGAEAKNIPNTFPASPVASSNEPGTGSTTIPENNNSQVDSQGNTDNTKQENNTGESGSTSSTEGTIRSPPKTAQGEVQMEAVQHDDLLDGEHLAIPLSSSEDDQDGQRRPVPLPITDDDEYDEEMSDSFIMDTDDDDGTKGLITSAVNPNNINLTHDDPNSHVDELARQLAEYEDELGRKGGVGIPIVDGVERPLLAPYADSDPPECFITDSHGEKRRKKCLILDLDETLVHSSFKKMNVPSDFAIPVVIEGQQHTVYVVKRPGVDDFLIKMAEFYEIVVFTASLSLYADAVLDHLDILSVIKDRLFRESCVFWKGIYVKDLSQLGRPLSQCIIIDNSSAAYYFHPQNAIPITTWYSDPHDTELISIVPFLEELATVDDVRSTLSLIRHLDEP